MGWTSWRWFLAGYAAGPLLLAFWFGERFVATLALAPLVWLLSPVGLILGMLCGIAPGWGPWGGRLVFMGSMAGLVALVAAGLWLEDRNPVPNGGDGTLRVLRRGR